MTRTTSTALAAALALVVPATAQAHVTLQPGKVTAGQFTRMDVRVPNERDDKGTMEVVVQLPDGFAFASTESAPGWEVKAKRGKAPKPLELHGETYDEQVTEVSWTAKDDSAVIQPGEFRDFGLSVRVPEGAKELTFKALQTYEGGEVVRWIGAEDSDNPASVVSVSAAAPAAQTTVVREKASTGLGIAGLVLGGLGLLAGGAALARTRKATA